MLSHTALKDGSEEEPCWAHIALDLELGSMGWKQLCMEEYLMQHVVGFERPSIYMQV